MRSVEQIDSAADQAVLEVSARLEEITRETFGSLVTYKSLDNDERFLVSRIVGPLVYQATLRNLGKL